MSKKYDVGYKKPPRHTRWQKGQSGNLGGRPKGKVKTADLDAVLDEALSALISVNENGRARKISRLRALSIQTINKGLKGHHQSTNLIMSLLARRGAPAEPDALAGEKTDEEARKEIDAFLNEIRANLSKSAGATNPQNDISKDSADKPKSDGKGAKPKDE